MGRAQTAALQATLGTACRRLRQAVRANRLRTRANMPKLTEGQPDEVDASRAELNVRRVPQICTDEITTDERHFMATPNTMAALTSQVSCPAGEVSAALYMPQSRKVSNRRVPGLVRAASSNGRSWTCNPSHHCRRCSGQATSATKASGGPDQNWRHGRR